MTVFSGFFNSLEGDRKYNAEHFSKFFDGIICDGVYTNFEGGMAVTPGNGLSVNVASGRAWFKRVWVLNDATLGVSFDAADPQLPRIDAVVIDVDISAAARTASIHVVKGTAHSSPTKPTLIDTDNNTQYPLCYVTIPAGAIAISDTNIEDCMFTGELPAVEALLTLSSHHLDLIDQRFDADENPVYTEAATLSEPTSGEPALTLYGKIKKLFSTLFAARNHTGNPKFLRHDLSYAEPPVVDTTKPGYCPQRPAGDAAMVDGNYKYLRADGEWTVPPNTQNNNAVAQNSAQDQNANLKVLLSQNTPAVNDVDSTKWDDDFRYNPSTNNLTVPKLNGIPFYDYVDSRGNDQPGYVKEGVALRLLDTNDYSTLQSNFQAGVDVIHDAIADNGITLSTSTPNTLAGAIKRIRCKPTSKGGRSVTASNPYYLYGDETKPSNAAVDVYVVVTLSYGNDNVNFSSLNSPDWNSWYVSSPFYSVYIKVAIVTLYSGRSQRFDITTTQTDSSKTYVSVIKIDSKTYSWD